MANEELGKLSPEQIQKLAGTISEAKNLTSQQEEIIQRVLAGEIEIGNTRIAALEKYFDSYSKNLDLIARKYSDLDDTFLILGKKLNDNYKTLSSDILSLEQQLSGVAKSSRGAAATSTSNEVQKAQKNEKELSTIAGTVREILQTLQKNNTLASYKDNTGIIDYAKVANNSSGGKVGSGGSTTSSGSNATKAVNEYVDADARNALPLDDIKNIELSDVLGELEVQEAQILEHRKERNQKHLEVLLRASQDAHTLMLDLAIARHRTEEEIENKKVEARINRLKEADAAELKAQELRNKLIDEQAAAKTKKGRTEIAKTTARQVNATEELKSLQELEKQRADLRAELTLEAMAKTNGKLTEKDAAEIERQVNTKYKLEEKALKDLTKQRLESEKLAQFAKKDPQMAQALEKKKADLIAKLEYEARKKNHGKLTEEEKKVIKKQADERYKLDEERLKKLEKEELKRQKKEQQDKKAASRKEVTGAVTGELSKEHSLLARFSELIDHAEAKADDAGGGKGATFVAALDTALSAISDLAAQLDSSIDKIALYQGNIDTRLQGSNNEKSFGSYWNQLTKDMMSVGAVTPFFKQEDFANNIKSLVERGIAFDLKQRAFLMTIQEKIANTFDVADGTLLRLIRIQQEDSTAGRLGMESALNSFLNEMYETSEYLSDVAKGVRSSLEEMEALMTGAEATEVEYQVQKWMGSLYSVGMSQEAVQGIASALGQIAAGQVDALTSGNGASNLLVMAANDAGVPIADILAKGLDAEDTNKLLQSTVNYLAEIAEASKDNNVVQQQLASVFGVRASDLRAAVNLKTPDSTGGIFNEYLTYGNMLKQLNDMAGSMYKRTSIGEMMTNIWDNGQYTLAGSMANNPIAYLTYKMASLLDATAGGIAIPGISVMGNMVDLETTVADLMRVAAVSTGILGSIGPMISGLGASFSGRAMLEKMGISAGSGLTVTPRGNNGVGANDLTNFNSAGGGAQTTSGSGYVGNASGSDIKNSTLQEAEDSKKQQMIEAKEEAEANQIDFINTNVLKIYELLDEVTSGKRSFSVKNIGYGLTNNTYSSGAQGGVNGLLSNSPANNGNNSLSGGFTSGATSGTAGSSYNSTGGASNGNNSGSNTTGNDSFGLGSNINLGGWTVT
jgi:DNA repair exonuclease SbcCD ATPase subunit